MLFDDETRLGEDGKNDLCDEDKELVGEDVTLLGEDGQNEVFILNDDWTSVGDDGAAINVDLTFTVYPTEFAMVGRSIADFWFTSGLRIDFPIS